MTGVNITCTQESNNFEQTTGMDIPFKELLTLQANNITVVKELLMSYDDNTWLKRANEIVLKKIMSWKEN